MLRGLKVLHSARVVHRDLKPSNLLVNSNCDLALCDYGLARGLACERDSAAPPLNLTEYVVTRWYRAPEIMLGSRSYSLSVDMWSVGCILAELLRRKPLFPGTDYMDQLRLIAETLGAPAQADLAYVRSDKARSFMGRFAGRPHAGWGEVLRGAKTPASPECVDLLARLLAWSPAGRPSVDEALAHPYMASLHCADDEPACAKGLFDFGFEAALKPLDKGTLQRLMLAEITSLRSEQQGRAAAPPPVPPPVPPPASRAPTGGGSGSGGPPSVASSGATRGSGAASSPSVSSHGANTAGAMPHRRQHHPHHGGGGGGVGTGAALAGVAAAAAPGGEPADEEASGECGRGCGGGAAAATAAPRRSAGAHRRDADSEMGGGGGGGGGGGSGAQPTGPRRATTGVRGSSSGSSSSRGGGGGGGGLGRDVDMLGGSPVGPPAPPAPSACARLSSSSVSPPPTLAVGQQQLQPLQPLPLLRGGGELRARPVRAAPPPPPPPPPPPAALAPAQLPVSAAAVCTADGARAGAGLGGSYGPRVALTSQHARVLAPLPHHRHLGHSHHQLAPLSALLLPGAAPPPASSLVAAGAVAGAAVAAHHRAVSGARRHHVGSCRGPGCALCGPPSPPRAEPADSSVPVARGAGGAPPVSAGAANVHANPLLRRAALLPPPPRSLASAVASGPGGARAAAGAAGVGGAAAAPAGVGGPSIWSSLWRL